MIKNIGEIVTPYLRKAGLSLASGYLEGIQSPRHQADSPPANSPPRNDLATNVLATKRSLLATNHQ